MNTKNKPDEVAPKSPQQARFEELWQQRQRESKLAAQKQREATRSYLKRAAARLGTTPSDIQERQRAEIALEQLNGKSNTHYGRLLLEEARICHEEWTRAEKSGEDWKILWRRVVAAHLPGGGPSPFPQNGRKVTAVASPSGGFTVWVQAANGAIGRMCIEFRVDAITREWIALTSEEE